VRLAIVQRNATVGDIEGAVDSLSCAMERAEREGADLLLAPELTVCGYPPKDLLLLEGFVEACEEAVARLARRSGRCVALIGSPRRCGNAVRNSLFALKEGAVQAVYDKQLLPTYDVFDEDRYFEPGDKPVTLDVAGLRVGLAICEDLWKGRDAAESFRYRDRPDPIEALAKAGAQLIVSPSASPFALGKTRSQRDTLVQAAQRTGAVVAAVNQVGANDELIFPGAATAHVPLAEGGARLVAAGALFEEDFLTLEIPAEASRWGQLPSVEDPLLAAQEEELLFSALVLGVRDYCRKTGFTDVALGLSGGIDSAVTACVAAAAVGAEHVVALALPSRYSSTHSVEDAKALASALGVRLLECPIEPLHSAAERTLEPLFRALGAPTEPGTAEENVQARIRGLLLMAVSNKTGALLLSTGNKSELAVGYCTLYGDMNGGLAVLADVLKTQVYALARWINAHPERVGAAAPPIPQRILDKPPSAELRPNQTDQDALPPYDELDRIVERIVTRRQQLSRIVRETGLAPELVERVAAMIDASEHKRRQLPVGLKVTPVAFGSGRRMPIAQRWRQRL